MPWRRGSTGSWRNMTVDGVRGWKTLRFRGGRSELMALAGKHEGALGAAFSNMVAESLGNRTPRDTKELCSASVLKWAESDRTGLRGLRDQRGIQTLGAIIDVLKCAQ